MNAYASGSRELRARQKSYVAVVERLVAHHTYDAIHAHDWLTWEAGVRAKELTGKPLVAHVHSTEFDRCGQTNGNPLAHEIEYNCLLMADRIVAVSQATKATLVQRYGLPPDTIEVVYNMADPALLAPQPETTHAYVQKMQKHGYKVVVSLGRLTVQKGLTHLLAAAQRALQINPKLLFVIAGDGDQRDELVMRSAELGISQNVIFTGFLRGQRWRDAYRLSDMFVMSSVSEPFGLTALEAAGSGTAVILSKQSGVSEVLHNALRFDFWDTEKLANYIVSLAEQDVLRDTLAANAKREVAAMSWQRAASAMQHIYQNLAGAAT